MRRPVPLSPWRWVRLTRAHTEAYNNVIRAAGDESRIGRAPPSRVGAAIPPATGGLPRGDVDVSRAIYRILVVPLTVTIGMGILALALSYGHHSMRESWRQIGVIALVRLPLLCLAGWLWERARRNRDARVLPQLIVSALTAVACFLDPFLRPLLGR